MKLFAESGVPRFLAAIFALAVLGSSVQGQEDLPIEDVIMPIDVYDDGTVKTRVTAARARIPAAGDIVAVDAKIEFYTPDGKLESRIISERVRYDRQNGIATSDGHVRYERKGVVITGEGFEWHAAEQFVKILHDSKVVFWHSEIKGLRKRLGRSEKE